MTILGIMNPGSNIMDRNGNDTAPVIEPMDMRFVMNTTITTMPSAENPSAGLIPTAAPNIVATPLPPLNLYITGHM